MVNYKTAKIYKLVNDELNLTYYGSTCNELRKRFWSHKSEAKNKYKCSSYKLFESGECKIYLVEKFPCEDKMELTKRERFYIENNECVNNNIPNRTQKEWREEHKKILAQQKKEYVQENKEQIAKQKKEHYQNNKEQIKEKMKEYYEKNNEVKKEKAKQYYQANKETMKKISFCECGGKYTHVNKARHCRSKKHQNFINSQNILV